MQAARTDIWLVILSVNTLNALSPLQVVTNRALKGENGQSNIPDRWIRAPIKPATLAGYQAAVNWLNEAIGDTTLAEIKNEVAKQIVIKMKAANLADKTIVNYFHVVQAVVASAVSSEGEQLYPRNWNFHFIGLPVIDEKKQRKPSFTAMEVEQILERAKGRYKVLFTLLAGTGMRR
jgi:integrase